jgi:hypothetical protein
VVVNAVFPIEAGSFVGYALVMQFDDELFCARLVDDQSVVAHGATIAAALAKLRLRLAATCDRAA